MYLTLTFVVKVPDGTDVLDLDVSAIQALVADPEAVMFGGVDEGVTRAALTLGAEPGDWT